MCVAISNCIFNCVCRWLGSIALTLTVKVSETVCRALVLGLWVLGAVLGCGSRSLSLSWVSVFMSVSGLGLESRA